MQTFIAKVISLTFIGFTLFNVAHAQIVNPLKVNTLTELLLVIIDAVIILAVPVVVLAIVYAGFLFVTAGGSEQKLTSAKKIFFWSLVGALILFGARVIADVVCNTIAGVSDLVNCE